MDRSASRTPAAEAARLVPALAHAERSYARAVAAELGLSPIDLYALGDLLSGEAAGVAELGRRLGLSSPAATGLADRLEAAGHIRREPHPHDRRRRVLVPTDDARGNLLARLSETHDETRRLADGFSSRELDAITRFLAGVIEIYEAAANSGEVSV